MSITSELGASAQRLKGSADRLIALLKRHEIRSIPSLVSAIRENSEFSAEWREIWQEIAAMDGGKLSLTTVGAVLGMALGGVGIAAGGGAIGLPLALVLGLGGLFAGSEFDALRRMRDTKLLALRIPKPIHQRAKIAAAAAGVSVNEIVLQALAGAFPDPDEVGGSLD